MKGKRILGVLLLMAALPCSAQNIKLLQIHGGYLNPKGTASGMVLGGNYGIVVDERVDLSIGFDYFHKSYVQETVVADTGYTSGINENTVMRELEYGTTLIPLSLNATIRFPFQPPLYWYVGAGLSWQFLFNTENNYTVKEKRNYNGFGYMFRAGIDYTLGSRSSLILEAFYNQCKVKGNKDKKQGFPVWDEVDVSGLGFRGGIKVELY